MSKRKLILAKNPLLSGPALEERTKLGIPYREIDINLIDPDPNQPRTSFDPERLNELKHSIETYGVLSPVLVRPGKVSGRFILIAGERRFRASQLAGKKVIPALIDSGQEGSADRTLAMQLVENLQRADLSSLERAHAIGALRDSHHLSVRDIAERLGISKSMVQRSLDILTLPDDLLNALRGGASESKILLLAKIDDPEIRATYLKDIESLTRGQLQKNLERQPKNSDDTEKDLSPDDKRVVEEIQRAVGLRVRLMRSSSQPEAGKLSIDFYSNSDLQELFRKLVAEI